ncbi:class I SAM-dependent methyltransferase [Demequina salsinemoris]|uniref:class I SAM-dependent methyltransferase n=1 Tax=Demequina salsinemoris TaxID=577470 RepID=UPI0007807979|nr:class I SAM-dependent methyltransferase [Demequina salsinemoris]
MPKDVWGPLVDHYDEWHSYMAGADLVGAVSRAVAGAVPRGYVVELGCGTGIYTRGIARSCDRVLALDASGPMVEQARVELAHLANVEVREADAYATGLPDGEADGVVAVNLLHIVPDPELVVREMRRIVRPGGSVVIADATVTGLSAARVLESVWRTVRRPEGFKTYRRGQHDISQTTLESLVHEAGFESVAGDEIDGKVMNSAFIRATAPAVSPIVDA